MIDPATLTENDKGRKVVYHREWCDHEYGVLSSWNEKFVFVRFKGPGGEACEPRDVSWHIDLCGPDPVAIAKQLAAEADRQGVRLHLAPDGTIVKVPVEPAPNTVKFSCPKCGLVTTMEGDLTFCIGGTEYKQAPGTTASISVECVGCAEVE